MLRSLREFDKYAVSATDGDLGHVGDFLIDDEHWAVRYLVVETGDILDRRRVLISAISFGRADWATHRFHLALTLDQIRSSPGIDTDKPVSRQHEGEFLGYYGYQPYWGQSALWGMGLYPGLLASSRLYDTDAPPTAAPAGDAHLRSTDELHGYHIRGSDGAIGHVEDFILDDESWAVRFLVIDTSDWWFGKKVLVAPRWAESVSWDDRTIHLDISRAAVKSSPEWNPEAPVNRELEQHLYDYYGRPVDWGSEGHPAEAQPKIPSSTT
ncbi:MAG: PRC-barrel domain-containing protein [Gemmatimonadota bacterium]|nr:PRC-barrel domain-containing protein [Gemmatimonadota bacterium]